MLQNSDRAAEFDKNHQIPPRNNCFVGKNVVIFHKNLYLYALKNMKIGN